MTSNHPSSRAFTLVELLMGMALATLVMAALATFMNALGDNWRRSMPSVSAGGVAQAAQPSYLQRWTVTSRVQQVVRNARMIDVVASGSSDGTAPGAVVTLRTAAANPQQLMFSELEVLYHDPTSRTLNLLRPRTSSTSLGSVGTFSGTNFLVSSSFTSSRSVTEIQRLRGVETVVLARDVIGARFNLVGVDPTALTVSSSTAAPVRQMLEMVLVFDRDGRQVTEYGSATVRGSMQVAQQP